MMLLITGVLIGITLSYFYIRFMNNQTLKHNSISPNEKRLIRVVDNSKDGFYYFEVNPEWRYLYAHPPFELTFGEERGKLVYDNPEMAFERVHPDDREALMRKLRGEIDYNQPVIYRIAIGDDAFNKGEYTLFEEYTTPVYQDGELVAIQGVLRDITKKKELERQLEYRITHDRLTGLYNREYFENQIEKYGKEENRAVGIIIIDLDNLKITNDSYGHRQGDRLIKETAGLLMAYSDDKINVSRIGGDEFVIIVIDADLDKIEYLVRSIRNSFNEFNENNKDLKVHFSIGFSFSHNSIGKMDIVYMEADKMMYEDKRKRKVSTSNKLYIDYLERTSS